MNITVYCGASFGSKPAFREAAGKLGQWIGASGHRLVYGGSCVGTMGVLADAVLEAGGEVYGVEPHFMIERELQHDGITKLFEVDTMSQRKDLMIELGEAFVALPGGVGTLEEISEVASRIRLDLVQAPCAFFNLDGFYDDIERYFDHMAREGFLPPEAHGKIVFARTFDALTQAICP